MTDALGDEAFDIAVIELLGPAALAGDKMSLVEAARIFWDAGRGFECEACAQLCDEEASCEGIAQKCAEKIRAREI